MGLTVTAGGLPNTRFYLDDGTGTFPDDITPYVLLVEGGGMSLTRGRSDTDTAVTAGTLNITLNNKTGAFTPGSTILGSPTQIKLDQRIRVKETVNGVTYTRGTYYVKSWALSWLAVLDGTAVVRVVATDAQARAERRVLRSVVEEEIMLDAPSAYYTLGEPATNQSGTPTTSAADTSGNQAPAVTIAGSGSPVVFGSATGPGTDDLTGATFNNGQYLSTILTFASTPTSIAIGFFFTTSTASMPVLRLSPVGAASNTPIVLVSGTGKLGITDGVSLIQSSASVADGAVHHGLLVLTTTTATVYVDGATAGSSAFASTFTSSMLLEVGGANFVPNVTYPSFSPSTAGMIGSLEHVTIFTTPPSAARIAQESAAGLTGFAGESGVSRITRLAGYAGIAVGSADTSLTNVPFVDFTDQSAWQAIQDVCDAEMGVAYINGSGTLDFHNRQRVTVKTAPDLTLNGFIRPDAEAATDDQDLLNYLTVTSVTTGIDQLVRDTASETAHGRYSDAKSFLVATDGEALDRGNWLIYTRKEPASSGRYGTLTINLYGMAPAQQSATVAALEHGCWLRAVAMPTQTTGGTTVDVVVEGIAENQSGDDWSITCNVVAKAALYPKVFILDSSVLDGPDLLAV